MKRGDVLFWDLRGGGQRIIYLTRKGKMWIGFIPLAHSQKGRGEGGGGGERVVRIYNTQLRKGWKKLYIGTY